MDEDTRAAEAVAQQVLVEFHEAPGAAGLSTGRLTVLT